MASSCAPSRRNENIIGGFLGIMSEQSSRLSRKRSMIRSAKRLRMWWTDVHQARPDVAGAYGLYASSQDYSIHWSDCTGAYASPHFQWSNLDPLIQFVESLYRPPEGHRYAHDQTVSLDTKPNTFVPDEPHWYFPMLPNCSFCMIFVSPAHSRGTRIFQQHNYRDQQKAPLIVKEVYLPESGCRYEEAEMLECIHSNGVLHGHLRTIEPKSGPTVCTP